MQALQPSRREILVLGASLVPTACGAHRVSVPPGTPPPALSHGTPGAPAADLDAVLEPIRARAGLPALAAAVYDEDNALARGAVGVRRLGDPTAVTRDDRWHIGSDTKAMTATLVARLVERGTVRWETSLAEALPDLAPTMDPAYRAVTLEQVLQHRGGILGDLLTLRAVWAGLWTSNQAVTQQRHGVAAAVLALSPETPPGTFRYANAGYMIVGAALERATGRPWEDLLRDEVFTPLGMTTGGFGSPASIGQVDQPWGHRVADGELTPVAPGLGSDNPAALGPAGTVHCSLDDWARFARVHLRGARGEATGYLAPERFARLHAPPPGGEYALGWAIVARPWAGGTTMMHAGSNTMFHATIWLAPARRRVLLVATNADNPAAAEATEAALGAMIHGWVPR